MNDSNSVSARVKHELAHGRYLVAHDPERIWGWHTPAGQLRAKRRAQMIIHGAGLKPGMSVVEVGCGTGFITERLAGSGANITAIDLSPELLARARARGLKPSQVRFIEGRFESWGLDDTFDAVVGSSVLHHLEVDDALRRMRQLLKPGGKFSFAEPNMLNPQVAVQKHVPFIKRWMGESPDETAFIRWRLKSALQRAGFGEIEIQPFDWLHPLTPRWIIPTLRAVEPFVEWLPAVREFSGSLLCRAIAE